jgi:hypothetical protein
MEQHDNIDEGAQTTHQKQHCIPIAFGVSAITASSALFLAPKLSKTFLSPITATLIIMKTT